MVNASLLFFSPAFNLVRLKSQKPLGFSLMEVGIDGRGSSSSFSSFLFLFFFWMLLPILPHFCLLVLLLRYSPIPLQHYNTPWGEVNSALLNPSSPIPPTRCLLLTHNHVYRPTDTVLRQTALFSERRTLLPIMCVKLLRGKRASCTDKLTAKCVYAYVCVCVWKCTSYFLLTSWVLLVRGKMNHTHIHTHTLPTLLSPFAPTNDLHLVSSGLMRDSIFNSISCCCWKSSAGTADRACQHTPWWWRKCRFMDTHTHMQSHVELLTEREQ